MLQSNSTKLKIKAARAILRAGLKDSEIMDVAHEELLKGYQTNGNDRHHLDAMSWLCKVLGASGQTMYKATLERVSKEAPHRKLRKHADKALRALP